MVNYVQEGGEGVNYVQYNIETDMSEDAAYLTGDEYEKVETEGYDDEGIELDNKK